MVQMDPQQLHVRVPKTPKFYSIFNKCDVQTTVGGMDTTSLECLKANSETLLGNWHCRLEFPFDNAIHPKQKISAMV